MKSLWIMMLVTIAVILAIFFYAFLLLPMYEAPSVAEDVEMDKAVPKVMEGQTETVEEEGDYEDPVLFTFYRTQQHAMEQFLLDHPGMVDINTVEKHLDKQDYTRVLKALWSEEDQGKRLAWLRDKTIESHPILLFELAVEEIKADPTVKGFEEALFLLDLGKYRTALDAVCVKDNSAQAAAQSLYNTYSLVIAAEVRKHPELVNEVSGREAPKISLAILERLHAALQEISKNLDALPSPKWVSYHALKMLFLKNNLVMPAPECQEQRKKLLEAYISDIQKQIEQLKPKDKEKGS